MITTLPVVSQNLSYDRLDPAPRPCLRLVCGVRVFGSHGYGMQLLTEEVSCEGFTCVSPVRFPIGEVLPCEWTIGSASPDLSALVLACRVEVLRSIHRGGEDGGYVVSYKILDYTTAPRRSAASAR